MLSFDRSWLCFPQRNWFSWLCLGVGRQMWQVGGLVEVSSDVQSDAGCSHPVSALHHFDILILFGDCSDHLLLNRNVVVWYRGSLEATFFSPWLIPPESRQIQMFLRKIRRLPHRFFPHHLAFANCARRGRSPRNTKFFGSWNQVGSSGEKSVLWRVCSKATLHCNTVGPRVCLVWSLKSKDHQRRANADPAIITWDSLIIRDQDNVLHC